MAVCSLWRAVAGQILLCGFLLQVCLSGRLLDKGLMLPRSLSEVDSGSEEGAFLACVDGNWTQNWTAISTGNFSSCKRCSNESLAQTSDDLSCSCDVNCERFGDCCSDKPPSGATPTIDIDPLWVQCRSIHLVTTSSDPTFPTAYWMISRCPVKWRGDNTTRNSPERLWIEGNCTDGAESLPPASDLQTGRLYKNEFCSLCHGVSSSVLWEYRAHCNASFVDVLQNSSSISQSFLQEHCTVYQFSLPKFFASENVSETPRPCIPHVATCLPLSVLNTNRENNLTEANYKDLLRCCTGSEYNLVLGHSFLDNQTIVARNPSCAICNGLDWEIRCINRTLQSNSSISELSSYVTISINLVTAEVRVEADSPALVLLTNCTAGQLLDIVTGECREVHCLTYTPGIDFCLHGYANIPSAGVSCQIITLRNPFHYVDLRNGFVFYVSVVVPLIDYDYGRPRICAVSLNDTDFGFNFDFDLIALFRTISTTTSVTTHSFSALSIIFVSLVLFTFIAFRKLHSIYGLVVINLSISIIFGDISLMMGERGTSSDDSDDLCIAAAIFSHLFSLAQFVWLAVLAVDLSLRYYRLANSLPPRPKPLVAVLYLGFGWLIPLFLTLMGILGDFGSDDLVLYAEGSLCLISSLSSTLVLLVIPLLISLLSSTVLIVGIMIILHRMPYRYDKRDKCNFCVFITLLVFMLTLGTVGLIAILVDSPVTTTGANLGYLLVNCVRSGFFACAFLFRRKVINVYLSLCGISRENRISPLNTKNASSSLGPLEQSTLRSGIPHSEEGIIQGDNPLGEGDEPKVRVRFLNATNFSPPPSLIDFAARLENPNMVPDS